MIPTWKGPSPNDSLFSLSTLVDDIPSLWDLQYLWLGGNRVTANSLICISGKQRGYVVKELIQSAQNYAKKHHHSGIIWPFLSLHEANEVAKYCPSARVILHSADSILHVHFNGLQEFIKAARRNDRKKWLKEIKSFYEYSATVEWKPLDRENMQLASSLIEANRSKYGSTGGVEWMDRIFTAQIESRVAEKAVAALCCVENHVTAIAIFYKHHDWLYGRYWGAEHNSPPYSYYVLTQYAAIEWAAQHGFRRIHLSISSWESKVRRGAMLYPLAMVILPVHDKQEWITEQVVFEHNKSLVEHWKNRFLTRPEALDLSWPSW